MKIKVIGWASYDDCQYEEGDVGYAAHEAILRDVKENGYMFSGYQHQEHEYCTPVLSDGKIYRYSQRGWGSLIAEAQGLTDPMDYARFSFYQCGGNEEKFPDESRSMYGKVMVLAKELLPTEENDKLHEMGEGWVLRKPSDYVSDDEVETLSGEDAEGLSIWDTVHVVPRVVYDELVERNPYEEFVLREDECTFTYPSVKTLGPAPAFIITERPGKVQHVVLKDRPELAFIAKGDIIRVGSEVYQVNDVERRKDVSEEVMIAAMYSSNPKYAEAVAELKVADTLLDLTI